MSQILLIEDDDFLAKSVRLLLRQNGFEPTVCHSKQSASVAIASQSFDLCLVDLMLPDGTGFELCREIRTSHDWPILILSADSDEESMIKGLEMGADDYITKPFLPRVLISRIRANLRRCQIVQNARGYVCGELRLDAERQMAWKGDVELALGKTEYQILEYMMRHAELAVRREDLFAAIWDYAENYIEDNTLTVTMSRLRRKIGLKPDGTEYIETIRGVGYRLGEPCRMM